MSTDRIVIRGAREHNLKNVSLELPRDQLIVFTGLSGSGKSSLAFDTIYAEGQRRYVESLSAYARQFLGQMEKPDVDFIEGLSPAISIDQKTASRNPRSTVGTVTEIHDYLRLLFARAGMPHCPKCGEVVARQTPQQIVDRILELAEGTRFQVLAPVVRGRKGEYEALLKELAGRASPGPGSTARSATSTEDIRLDRYYQHTIEVIVDRLVRKDGIERRLTDSLETALRLAEGVAVVDVDDGPTLTFSQHFACDTAGCRSRSCNPATSPSTAPTAPAPTATASAPGSRSIGGWRSPTTTSRSPTAPSSPGPAGTGPPTTSRVLEGVAEAPGSRHGDPVPELDARSTGKSCWRAPATPDHGRPTPTGSGGSAATRPLRGPGAVADPPPRERRQRAAREFYQQYMRLVPCETCGGARLNPVALAVTIGGLNIHDVSSLSLARRPSSSTSLDLDDRQAQDRRARCSRRSRPGSSSCSTSASTT